MVAKVLVTEKIVACANIFPHIESLYLWKGALKQEKEVKVFFKTLPGFFEQVAEAIQKLCSYDVPEISCVHVTSGNQAYLSWMEGCLGC
ncbi:MAG: Divalent-cation tolerance protein CutA [Chlamydiae bacterium]|nr:Divalent-cation tolerance protein CutA [Chlamydiota bacterium]